MNKLITNILVFSYILAPAYCIAQEQTSQLTDNKAVIAIQKTPSSAKADQKQKVKNNWFCIVIQINGKIQETKKEQK